MKPETTIGIPAWQAESFLEATVKSAQAQTVDNIRILISVDESQDCTSDLARALAGGDDRIRVVDHDHRLGWIGNMNAVIDRVETEYFILLPHDDRLSPEYVERLVPLAREDDVAIAYGDITLETEEGSQLFTADLPQGPAVARMARFLMGRPNGVAMRGVTKTALVHARGVRLRNNAYSGFLAGTTYVLELLSLGLAVRLPEPLYTKWVRAESVHESVWKSWLHERQMRAWVEHTASCLEAIASARLRSGEEDLLASVALDRLKRLPLPGGPLHDADVDSLETTASLVGLLSARLGRAEFDVAEAGPYAKLVGASRARSRFAEAIELRNRQHPWAAAGLLGDAVRLDESFAEAHIQRAAILFDLGCYESGLVSAIAAVRLLPRDPRTHVLHSRLLAACGDLHEALSAAEAARNIDPGHPHLTEHLAWLASEIADRQGVHPASEGPLGADPSSESPPAADVSRWGTKWRLRSPTTNTDSPPGTDPGAGGQ